MACAAVKSDGRASPAVALPAGARAVALGVLPPAPLPGASHRPAASAPPPTVNRSGLPSPVRSPSAAVAAGAALNGTADVSPKLLPADNAVTVTVFARRPGVT